MAAYVVSYDLHKQGQNYDCIIKKLNAYPTHWHMQGSVWVIVTTDNAVTIYNNLQPCLDNNDKLFVGEITKNSAWSPSYGEKVKSWLSRYL